MKLRRVEFKNFKLLDGVVIDFSTDPRKPLTVVRAENGSGKTSLLWGLAWAFYGDEGLPTKKSRLSSTERPSGVPTMVQVVVDFEHDPDDTGTVYQYVLTRTVQETPGNGDEVSHGPMSTKLLIRTKAGEEPVPGEPTAVLETFVPRRLKEVFLTDGDRVQRFISGTVAKGERQYKVHEAIRALLGLDRLDEAEQDLIAVEKQFRKELAESGGQDVQAAQEELEACENSIAEAQNRHDSKTEERVRIEEYIDEIEAKLQELKGHGDLDQINADLSKARKALTQATTDEAELLESIRALFKSDETLSWSIAHAPLEAGRSVLAGLYDRGVIPGSSRGVLQDRLDEQLCICGESLAEGTAHRAHVLKALEKQAAASAEQVLTETFHRTRAGVERFEAARADAKDFWGIRPSLLQRQTEISDRQKEAQQRVRQLEDRREQIDEEEVRRHTTSLQSARRDVTDRSEEIGALDRQLLQLAEEKAVLQLRYETAQGAAKSDAKARHRHEIAEDLKILVTETLSVLKNEHVKAVSDRMHEIFMEIVGSSPELQGAVFHGVHLTEDFDIIVQAGNQRTLDTDYEVNGASQRALTLAFIWALMEVSGTVAPRVIDTPLGMTAGGVKRRMVEAITKPVGTDHPDYQVVLLLTRSEIRDIEGLLDERTGRHMTLSCSKDYPADLVHDWGVTEPTILRCDCSHRQFCEVCEREKDSDYNLTRRV